MFDFVRQDPEIMLLQNRAFGQLTNNQKRLDQHKTSADSQLNELKKAARGKVVLMVLVRNTSNPNNMLISKPEFDLIPINAPG